MQKARQNDHYFTHIPLPHKTQRHGHENQPTRTRCGGRAHFIDKHPPAPHGLGEEEHDGDSGNVATGRVKAGGENVPFVVFIAEVTPGEFGVSALGRMEIDLFAGWQHFLGPLQPDDTQ